MLQLRNIILLLISFLVLTLNSNYLSDLNDNEIIHNTSPTDSPQLYNEQTSPWLTAEEERELEKLLNDFIEAQQNIK